MKNFKTTSNRRQWMALTAAACAAFSFGAQAQSTWPTKPVTLVVPFPAGGGTDAFARPFSAQFSKQSGKTLVIDNRGGAGGNLGAGVAAKAAPDGYTLFMGAVHHSIAPAMYPKLDYDLERDFVPIAMVANVPHVLVVNPKNVPGDFKAFMQMVRNNPGKFNYGSAGGGTSHHLAGELFKLQSKTFITHIPYRGAGPALQDLIAGNVDMMFDGLGSSAQHIKGGRIRALGVTSEGIEPSAPELPTVGATVKGYEATAWFGIGMPKNTPTDVIAKMNAEVNKALADPVMQKRLAELGGVSIAGTPADFGKVIVAETEKWAKVVEISGAKVE